MNLSDMPDQELKAGDNRLNYQVQQNIGNGMQLSRSLLHYFDTKVRGLLPTGDEGTKLYNSILHLITTALSPVNGFAQITMYGDFDGNGSGEKLLHEVQHLHVEREPGVDRPASVRITKDEDGKWQIVLTQTLPIGAKIKRCKDVDPVDSIDLKKFYLHKADLKFTMTIPLDQDPPAYKENEKDAPLVPQYTLEAEIDPVV